MLGLFGTGKLYVQAFGCHSMILTEAKWETGRLMHEYYQNYNKEYIILVRVNQH